MQTQLTPSEEIQQVELSIEEARKFLNKVEALERLEQNADFKLLVFDTYFVDEAARYTGLLAEPPMQGAHQQSGILSSLRGISEFRQFLLKLKLQGEQSRNDLQQQLELLEDLHEDQQNVEGGE